jgi:tripartite-type tricarboxylate transporter receptor subunit TctC
MKCAMKRINAVVHVVTAALLLGIAVSSAAQQAYPAKAIRFISPYAPGGATDVIARLVGQKLSEAWSVPVVVENRAGGNTVIGTEFVAKSAPDGYTIVLVGTTHVANASLIKTSYDAIKDFAPVATVTSNETVLVVHPSVPANTLQELIALAKAKPGELNYATSSTGGPTHIPAELFNIVAGVKTQQIPYKGGGPAMTDLLGGQVQMVFAIPSNVVGHVKSGKLRALAVTGEKRLAALPQVPTAIEQGLKGFDGQNWYGILAPAGTPVPVVNKMSAEIARILAMPDVSEKLEGQGMDPFYTTPEQFTALLKSDLAKYTQVIKTAKIKMDN